MKAAVSIDNHNPTHDLRDPKLLTNHAYIIATDIHFVSADSSIDFKAGFISNPILHISFDKWQDAGGAINCNAIVVTFSQQPIRPALH